jgi:hypothetical protein
MNASPYFFLSLIINKLVLYSIKKNFFSSEGLCCIFKEEQLEEIKKNPLLECTHNQAGHFLTV